MTEKCQYLIFTGSGAKMLALKYDWKPSFFHKSSAVLCVDFLILVSFPFCFLSVVSL